MDVCMHEEMDKNAFLNGKDAWIMYNIPLLLVPRITINQKLGYSNSNAIEFDCAKHTCLCKNYTKFIPHSCFSNLYHVLRCNMRYKCLVYALSITRRMRLTSNKSRMGEI